MLVALLAIRQRFSFQIPGNSSTISQPLDHFNPRLNPGFLSQTYWYNRTFVASEKPDSVIVYIGGDSEVDPDAVFSLAQRTHSTVLSLEHRFFGSSGQNLSDSTLPYLTIAQALEDIASFVYTQAIRQECRRFANCSVVVVGGSYLGALAAWARMKYPTFTAVGWASSAPVRIIDNFSEYDAHVAAQIGRLHPRCNDTLKAVLDDIESVVLNGTESEREEFLETYGFNNQQNSTSILYVVADVLTAPIQYGRYMEHLDLICNAVAKNQTWRAMNVTWNQLLKTLNVTTAELDPTSPADNDDRAWSWLRCTQLGWFQTSSGFRSSQINLTYFDRVCWRLFNRSHSNTTLMNSLFGGNNPMARNVFFANGAIDPWSTLSAAGDNSLIERRSTVIGSGTHCSDLQDEQPDVTAQIEDWLNWSFEQTGCCDKGGFRVLSQCKCPENHAGTRCTTATYSNLHLTYVTTALVLVTTILLLIVGGALWGRGYDDDGDRTRPKLPIQ
jgi:serine protease 16